MSDDPLRPGVGDRTGHRARAVSLSLSAEFPGAGAGRAEGPQTAVWE